MNNPINWFEVCVQDMDRAKSFYESVFEARLTKLESPLPGMELWRFPWVEGSCGATGALVKMEAPHGADGVLGLFFEGL